MTFFETIGKIIERYSSFFAQGVVNTLIIAAFSVLLGTILGTLMATMRMGKILPLKWLAVAYIEFIHGTPLMVQLMFIFYGLPMIGVKIPDISWIPNFSRFAAGVVAMSMNSCAYVAEVIRSGIQAVDYGQTEAARSVGFSSGEAMRLVVLPQAIKNILRSATSLSPSSRSLPSSPSSASRTSCSARTTSLPSATRASSALP